ncbi:MAG TPA: hypothetical protein VFE93_09580, partial [Myxococcaceae bacterium]|nr:hypothetical protein [Myxococcaceae bacterium]
MLALISQMLLCLLAAAVVGFAVAWVLRTGQVAELTSEVERLRALVPTGVLPSALSTRLELLARMMEEVKARPATEAAATELHRLLEAQQALQGTVSELARRPAPATPTVDLTPIVQKLETLSGSGELSSRLASVTTTLAALDLSPVQQRLDGLVAALDELRSRPALAVDLGPLHASQERAIEGLRASLATLADPSPIERRLDRLAQELAALRPRL